MLKNSVDAWASPVNYDYGIADAAFRPMVDSPYPPIITSPTVSLGNSDSLSSIPTPKNSDLCPESPGSAISTSDSTICDPEEHIEATCPHSFTLGTISCGLKRGAESPLERDTKKARLSEAKEQILTKGDPHSLGKNNLIDGRALKE